jgi:hypothetical protein
MSSTLTAPPGRPRRRLAAVPRFSKDPEVRSVQIGVLATIIVHLLLLLWLEVWLKGDHTPFHSLAKKPPAFEIEMSPESLTPPPKQQPNKFVETNPNAPDNVPDKTDQFGAQNQQVAQEKPSTENKSERPAIEGQKDIHSSQIVDGQLTQPTQPQQAVPPAPTPPTETTNAAKREQNPLSGFDKAQGDSPDSFGSNVAKLAPHSDAAPEKVEGVRDAPLIEGATAREVRIDPKKPMPRQTITQHVRPAIFEENKFGTTNVGPIAFDARWSKYGEYLQRLIEAIDQRWHNLVAESKHYPQPGTHVLVTFVLNSDGKISEIVKVDGTADSQAEGWCVAGISPNEGFTYGKWTDDMVAMLGTQTELTFEFFYQ